MIGVNESRRVTCCAEISRRASLEMRRDQLDLTLREARRLNHNRIDEGTWRNRPEFVLDGEALLT